VNTRPPAPLLLVDDQPANLLALEAVLQDLGEPLVRAGSGVEALRALRDVDFAAVLLDARMPDMDGFETARLIRAQRRSRETPIIFITADPTGLAVSEAYAMGAVDFMAKPLKPEVLRAKVGFFVELHRSKQELKAAERRAVQDRVFLSAVLEAIEDGIVACDADGVLTLFNRATREFHGRPLQSTTAAQWAADSDLYRPDGTTPLPAEEVPLNRALAGEHVRDAEFVIAPRGGKARTVLANGQPLQDENGNELGAVVSLHDISARQEVQSARAVAAAEQARREEAEAAAQLIRESSERLRASEERYRTLFGAMDEGFCILEMIFGEDGRALDYVFLETNPAFAKQSGMDDVIGKRMRELVPGHDQHWFDIYGRVVTTGVPVRFEDEAEALGRWFDVYATPLPAAGANRLAVLFNDITQRKHADDNLRRLAEELAESDRRKTEFLATLAHELRNPLAPISNGLHLMRMAGGDLPALEKARHMMERQLRHMVHLVDDLLDIARISSNKVELRRESLDLRTVLAGAVETSMPLVTAGGHALDVKLPDAPLRIVGDATRVAQVVSNLLNNAAKYTPRGGRIELAAREEGGRATIAVRDTGVGIPPESLRDVFDMFTQVGRSREHAQGGLGIGLALVRRLVDLHGGTVEAASDGAGRGSTFTVRLPLADAHAFAAEAAPTAPGAGLLHPRTLRVLVVDDNRDAADSLAALLEIGGHETRVAHDGDEALRAAHTFRPDIVFLDIGMPGKDGYEVARELRAATDTCSAVLVALTGWGAQQDRARSRSAGFDHHLTKPAGLHDVERLLADMALRGAPNPVAAA
jgi:PAS domain S-box-containing protein